MITTLTITIVTTKHDFPYTVSKQKFFQIYWSSSVSAVKTTHCWTVMEYADIQDIMEYSKHEANTTYKHASLRDQ